jgi:hypothetical protein
LRAGGVDNESRGGTHVTKAIYMADEDQQPLTAGAAEGIERVRSIEQPLASTAGLALSDDDAMHPLVPSSLDSEKICHYCLEDNDEVGDPFHPAAPSRVVLERLLERLRGPPPVSMADVNDGGKGDGRSFRIAIAGAGFSGAILARQLHRQPGFEVRADLTHQGM